MIRRHMSLIAEEKIRLVPRNLRPKRLRGQQAVQRLRRGSSGQRDRKASVLFDRGGGLNDLLGGTFRDRIDIGKNKDVTLHELLLFRVSRFFRIGDVSESPVDVFFADPPPRT